MDRKSRGYAVRSLAGSRLGWKAPLLLAAALLAGCQGKKQQGCDGIEDAGEKDKCLIDEIQRMNGPQMTEVIKKAKEANQPIPLKDIKDYMR